jgi:hypothetical protein
MVTDPAARMTLVGDDPDAAIPKQVDAPAEE